MLKRLLFLSLFLVAPGIAHAACPSPYTMKDAAAVTQNITADNDETNGCVFRGGAARAATYTQALQSGAGASGNGASLTVTGLSAAAITVNCSGCSGGTTINFEGQEDGANFRPIMASPTDGTAPATTTTTAGFTDWYVSTAGFQQIRARISAYSAGTITVTAHAFALPAAFPSTTVFQGGTWTVQPGNTANTTAWKVDGSAVTQPVSIATAPVLVAGSALIGKVGFDQTTPGTTNAIQEIPGANSGLTNFFLQPIASDNHTVVKVGAGQVYEVTVFNNSATINYLRFYNATTGFNGCNSAANLVRQYLIPANSTNGTGFTATIPTGLAFATGISICVTSGYATTDVTNATASAMSLNIGYK